MSNDFPTFVIIAHWINVLFIGFLIRAGIQIFAAYPRLYWNEHSTPGTEWLKFPKTPIPSDRLWTALEQEREVSAALAQPGGNNLGLGRHWHFFAAIFWVVNGLAYVILLIATGEWQRLVPTSLSIIPEAWQTMLTYLSLQQPPPSAFDPYDPLQQLAYFAVVFLLAPFLILTGAAQSPGIAAQFPRYARLFGGRQRARSLHFLGLLAFAAFIVVHTLMVIYNGFVANIGDITLGQHQTDQGLAVAIGLGLIIGILATYAITSWASRRRPRAFQHGLGAFIRPLMRLLAVRTRSHQSFRRDEISPYFPINGAPPETEEYTQLVAGGFVDWRLEVSGLVEKSLSLSLEEIRGLPAEEQITRHHCIQGWSAVAAWRGPTLGAILDMCRPLAGARYLVFHSFGLDSVGKRHFYETLELDQARHPQTILAYEMNSMDLPVPYGAPLRLRVETVLGFKMVKWLYRIELVDEYRAIGEGQGGSREDNMYYEQSVGI